MSNGSMRSLKSFAGSLSHKQRRRVRPRVEALEARNLLSAYPLTPVEVRHAYGFDQVSANGAGQTIAIIDAYDDPNIFKDLDTFDKTFSWSNGGATLYSQFGAASSVLTKVTPGGRTSANRGWAEEISLDVEWAHAIAPAAHIMLVEAKSASFSNLLAAVDYATNHGAQVVSMSWGASDFSGESAYDGHFSHTGITYIASAGDMAGAEWPAVSPNVLAIGGTSLNVDTSGNYLGETGWSSSGGGVSAYESKPAYQSAVTQSATHRTSPDVAYNADPNTGIWVYDSYYPGGAWWEFGGTSAGAPQWASLIALTNQGRTSPLSSSGTLNAVYSLPSGSTDLHDVTSGSSGSNSAGTGYDLVTGLGSPLANNLIPYLRGVSANVVTGGGTSGSPSGSGGHSIERSADFTVSVAQGIPALPTALISQASAPTVGLVTAPTIRLVLALPQVQVPGTLPVAVVTAPTLPAMLHHGGASQDEGSRVELAPALPGDEAPSDTPRVPAATWRPARLVAPAPTRTEDVAPISWQQAVATAFVSGDSREAVLGVGEESSGGHGLGLALAAPLAGFATVLGGFRTDAADELDDRKKRRFVVP